MRASTSLNVRTLWLSLLAGVLATAVWGAVLLSNVQSSSHLQLRANMSQQTADPGGTGTTS